MWALRDSFRRKARHVPGGLVSLGKVLYEASTAMDRHHFPIYRLNSKVFRTAINSWNWNDVIVQACTAYGSKRYPNGLGNARAICWWLPTEDQ